MILGPVRHEPATYQPSHGQIRLWFEDQLADSPSYHNMTVRFRVRGPLRVDALGVALAGVVDSHDVLRSRYLTVDDELQVEVASAAAVQLTSCPDGELGRAEQWVQAQVRRTFDLSEPPLLRVALVRKAADEHELVLTMHHIAADGRSVGIITHDLWDGYERVASGGSADERRARPPQYREFASRQRVRLESGALDAQRRYWTTRLNGVRYSTLPSPSPDSLSGPEPRGVVRRQISSELRNRIQQTARTNKSTVFVIVLSALAVAVHYQTGSPEAAIGVVTDTRLAPRDFATVGHFVNPAVLRVDVQPAGDLSAVLASAREALLGLMENNEVPFDVVVSDLRPARVPGLDPLIGMSLEVTHGGDDTVNLGELVIDRLESLGTGGGWYDLAVHVRWEETGEGRLEIEYATARFSAGQVAILADDLINVIDRVTEETASSVASLAWNPATAVAGSGSLRPFRIPRGQAEFAISVEQLITSLRRRPVQDLQYLIVDRYLRSSHPGSPGELVLFGSDFSSGDALSADPTKVIASPYHADGSSLLRTGLICLRQADGEVIWKGCIDDFIWFRGHEINLRLIELAIRDVSGVRDVCVRHVVDQSKSSELLCADVLGGNGFRDEAIIRRQIARTIPAFSVPEIMCFVPELTGSPRCSWHLHSPGDAVSITHPPSAGSR